MSREKQAFGKRSVGTRRRWTTVEQGVDEVDRMGRCRRYFNVVLIGGLPLHFLFFPLGMIPYVLAFLPFFLCLQTKKAMGPVQKIQPRIGAVYGYIGLYVALSIAAFYIPFALPTDVLNQMNSLIRLLLSWTPFADGMWHKLSVYGQHSVRSYDIAYLMFITTVVVAPAFLMTGGYILRGRFTKKLEEDDQQVHKNLPDGSKGSESGWGLYLLLVVLLAAVSWFLVDEIFSDDFRQQRYRLFPLLPGDPSNTNLATLMFNVFFWGTCVHIVTFLAAVLLVIFPEGEQEARE